MRGFCRAGVTTGMPFMTRMYGPAVCVAREIGEGGVICSCFNVSGLWVEPIWLLAIMEVSAHATS